MELPEEKNDFDLISNTKCQVLKSNFSTESKGKTLGPIFSSPHTPSSFVSRQLTHFKLFIITFFCVFSLFSFGFSIYIFAKTSDVINELTHLKKQVLELESLVDKKRISRSKLLFDHEGYNSIQALPANLHCCLPGKTGPAGLQGLPGFPGPIGVRGPRGVKGEKGQKGQMKDYLDSAKIISKLNEMQRWQVKEVKGQKGEPGDVGAKGHQGSKGAEGKQGVMGRRGKRGHKGERGDNGIPGSDSYCFIGQEMPDCLTR